MEPIFDNQLVWYPHMGIGFYPVQHPKTDYFDIYEKHDADPDGISEKLNAFRVELVNEFTEEEVVDFGIGNGTFIRTRGMANTLGYDVDAKAKDWLLRNNLYVNIHDKKGRTVEAMTFFDSLEHLRAPWFTLNKVNRYVFISIPIFRDVEHVMGSKHFKPSEHFWYFTDEGLKTYMEFYGFKCLFECDVESELGREDVCSYAFRRD